MSDMVDDRRMEQRADRDSAMDQKIEALVGSLIRNEKEMADLRQVAASVSETQAEATTFERSLQRLMDVHRETEAKLQVLIYSFERTQQH